MTLPWSYSALPARPEGRWPNGARVALWVAVGVESYRPDGGMTEDILPRGAAPDLVNAAWRDFGNRVGAFRLFDRLAAAGIRPAVLLNTDVYDEAPEVLTAARAVGAEIVGHGHSNSDSLTALPEGAEQGYVCQVLERIAREEGAAPGGWSSPWLAHTPTSLKSLHGAGYRYLLDLRLDDQPVWLRAGTGRILSIPYAAELNDSTTMVGRQLDARGFAAMIRDEAKELMASRHPVVMSVVLHSFISGQPWRLRPVAEALAEVAAMDGVWCATPAEIHAAVLSDPDLAAG
ncbi:polysaccharide deacetylase family protein [Sagittula stellata]|uniref:Polysaccharide deacetylase family protein n=1 Tax=Sagittula stellata (strain ATCC 700073 / DSM 11524 / E-37) TaxID=388399 RepID=A3K6Q3_SAGS3|nr:polysaccharide deacetylase family protein [Sagittula stellata]EBA07030.1 polysaccharide deacetylase family protein [Sagittula stellata E-37]